MKNAICVLANDMILFANMINNLPDIDVDLIVINETRIGNKINEIKEITKNIKSCIVIDSDIIINKFKNDVINCNFVDTYTMGMNILMQWYIFKYYDYDKVLFLDDDIVLTKNINNVFELNNSSFYIFTLSVGAPQYNMNTKKMKLCIDTFNDLFDLNINDENYREKWIYTHVNGGQRLYCKSDFNLDLYTYYLKLFYTNKNIEYLWNIRTNHASFYLDERFEGFVAYKSNIINNNLNVLTQLEFNNPDKINFEKYNALDKKAIWHIVARTKKLQWINNLKEVNKLK